MQFRSIASSVVTGQERRGCAQIPEARMSHLMSGVPIVLSLR
jgi:hypothetical protein